MRNTAEDLRERVFGRLTVKAQVEKPEGLSKHRRGAFWRCECRCGGVKIASAYNLKKGNISSCGCIVREKNEKAKARTAERKTGGYETSGKRVTLNKEDRRNLDGGQMICICAECKETFERISSDWKYQDKDKHGKRRYYCSWHCYLGKDAASRPKMTLTERARLQSINAI